METEVTAPVAGQQPLVSIVITSYNRAQYIETAIQSALNQDYQNLEIIISDNCSTDETPVILEKYINNSKVKVFYNSTNIGMLPNFKYATEQRATGKYISYISSDDYLSNPKFISTAIEAINTYPDIILVAAKNSTLFSKENKMIQHPTDHIFGNGFMKGTDVFKLFPKWLLPGWGAVLMNRDQLIRLNIFESKAQSLDYEANLKLFLNGNIFFINENSYVFRAHDSNASGTMNYETHITNLEFIENTYNYAKTKNIDIDLEAWRIDLYKGYLSSNVVSLINDKQTFVRLLNYIKKHKNISFSLLSAPKLMLNKIIYKHPYKWRPLLKWLWPKKYNIIQSELKKMEDI